VHPIGNVDFAGTDALLKSADYAEFPSLQLYPAVAGAVVPIFNVVGVDDLVLTPLLLSQIFRQCKSGLVCAAGSVSQWNDPRIIQLNPQHVDALNAAGQIKVIVRQDKSGTTEIWKNSLSAFEPAFAKQIGKGESNTWLNASVTLANLNEGVAATVLARVNTIGYSVLAEAQVLKLKTVGLKKESGNVVYASTQTISFAVMEKGADFGNNGDSPSRLTADIHNAKGTKAVALHVSSALMLYNSQIAVLFCVLPFQ
jgi:phosphate transport system substrate-binding protein